MAVENGMLCSGSVSNELSTNAFEAAVWLIACSFSPDVGLVACIDIVRRGRLLTAQFVHISANACEGLLVI